jgi:hypothetical protein
MKATIKERIHTSALNLAIQELKKNGVYYFMRPVAIQRAREMNAAGANCYAEDEYTVKLKK